MLLHCADALRLGLVVGKGSDGLGMVVCAGGGGRSVEWILALLNKYMVHAEKKQKKTAAGKKNFHKAVGVKLPGREHPGREPPEEDIQEESSMGAEHRMQAPGSERGWAVIRARKSV
jgi:hypothetical protein